MDLSDTQLIERTLGGEPDAFNTLVRRWERQIYGLTLRMLGRDDEARDATQETFIQNVTVSFLGLSVASPLALLVAVIYVLGALTGGSLYALLRRSIEGAKRSASR